MANQIGGNTYWVEESGEEITSTVYVTKIVFTSTGTASLLLQNRAPANTTILQLEDQSNSPTRVFDFTQAPLVFQDGIKVTASDCTATIVFRRDGATK